MAKRMFDSGKFDDPFYRKLPAVYKCVYEYLQSKCNYAGVLNIDIDDLNYRIPAKLTLEDIKNVFKDKFIPLEEKTENGKIVELKIFLPRFIYWQYRNELTPHNSVHRSVYGVFKDEGISIEPYLAPFVLKEDFEDWKELYNNLKAKGESYKDLLKQRKEN